MFHFSEGLGSMNAMGPVQSLRDARFSDGHGSINAMGPVQRGVTYFERAPLRSYFQDHQKNEIYFFTAFRNWRNDA